MLARVFFVQYFGSTQLLSLRARMCVCGHCCPVPQEEESAHFITYRNNLNKILTTPYSKQKWEMEVRFVLLRDEPSLGALDSVFRD